MMIINNYKYLILIACLMPLTLFGCAGGYHPDPNLPLRDMAREAWLESWQDKHIDDVIKRYGVPDKSVTLSDGGQVVEITRKSKEFRGGNYISGPGTTYSRGTVYGSGSSTRYSETTTSTGGGHFSPTTQVEIYCHMTFNVRPDGIVSYGKREGNSCR